MTIYSYTPDKDLGNFQEPLKDPLQLLSAAPAGSCLKTRLQPRGRLAASVERFGRSGWILGDLGRLALGFRIEGLGSVRNPAGFACKSLGFWAPKPSYPRA